MFFKLFFKLSIVLFKDLKIILLRNLTTTSLRMANRRNNHTTSTQLPHDVYPTTQHLPNNYMTFHHNVFIIEFHLNVGIDSSISYNAPLTRRSTTGIALRDSSSSGLYFFAILNQK